MVQVMLSFLLGFLAIGINQVFSSSIDFNNDTSNYNRPLIHFTPESGWMNDPNGLFYDKTDEIWHLYFQYNPNDTVWGQPLYWGHASSKDLVTWSEHEIAIGPEHDDEGIFSGSIVVDYNNTSGFFDSSIDPNQRVVAIYTNSVPGLQTQDIAYSLDGGYKFEKYQNNPVIDVQSDQFRDPKVMWHAPTNQWIMLVVKSQEYKIQIYGSPNLKDWALHSNFTSGYYGFQYECPGLIEIPIEDSDETKWVMTLAINPGSPLGGSINEYFVGDFDGFQFTADDTQTRFMDIGKDFYAFQTFSEVDNGVLGLAWASNWQYANSVPTNPWRSSMTLTRNYTLRDVNVNPVNKQLTLIQTPVLGDSIETLNSFEKDNFTVHNNEPVGTYFENSTGLIDFDVTFRTLNASTSHDGNTRLEIVIKSQKLDSVEDTITIGYDSVVPAFYLDRGIPSNPFDSNPFFTSKLSAYIEPLDDENTFQIYGIIDKNIIELYFNNGSTTMTNTFFMGEGRYPHGISVETNSKEPMYEVESLTIRELTN